jgi:sec-independent protein translocase protein TatA
MFGIGTQELLIIFLIVLLLFGASRIPEIAKAMGKGIRDFKKATQDVEDGIKGAGESPNRIDDTSASGVESPGTKTGQKTPGSGP